MKLGAISSSFQEINTRTDLVNQKKSELISESISLMQLEDTKVIQYIQISVEITV